MNSYKDLALYDMKSAKANYEYALWNKVGRECQQVCEKYLKYYLEAIHQLPEVLQRTHNLKKLIRAIPNYDKDIYRSVSIVGDYYFDTNYPGDDFIELDQELADEAVEIATSLMAYVDSLLDTKEQR